MINFILPGFYEHFNLNQKFVLLFEQHPEFFIQDFNFGCFYGNFGFDIWSGGRIFNKYKTAYREELENIRDFYNSRDIPIRLAFTNPIVEEQHLYDNFCNMVMNTLDNNKNEVVVNSELLEQYLREKYPNFKYCSSTTKCLTSIDDLKKELSKDYYQVCLDYNLNHNFTFLDTLNQQEKDKCEVLCNAICPPGCPNRKNHYKLNGLFSLNGGRCYTIECGINNNTISNEVHNYKNNIYIKEIQEVYYPKGFSHFKLEGRTLSELEVAMNLINYCIKDNYKNEALFLLLN